MEPDALQRAWRSQDAQQVTIDVESLLSLVKRNHRDFRSILLRRDTIEIGIALPLTVLFATQGVISASWSWFVMAAACLFIAVFMLADRYRQNRKLASPSDTLTAWADRSRADVEHQIWLLKNVFWWYLLPPLIGLTCVYGHHMWQVRHADVSFLVERFVLPGLLAASCAVLYAVYLLNQYAVRKDLEPRLEELKALTESLTHDPG